MSDMIVAGFRALREESKEKRAHNRRRSAQLLRKAGIAFESKNGGAHLIVCDRYDFWPGTGLWKLRSEEMRSRGVLLLIRRIRREQRLALERGQS